MRILLSLLGAVALSTSGMAATCTTFQDMQNHVRANFEQPGMETPENLGNIAGKFPGTGRCVPRKAGGTDPVARFECYWASDVESRFAALLQDLKTCYPNWQPEERTDPAAVRQVRLKQDEMRAGVWIVQLYNAKTRMILMLAYMQKVK